MLSVEGLKVWFPVRRGILNRVAGYVRAVDGVSLHVSKGETLGLVGESGCGKSTLGRAILGLERASEGDILFEGKSVASMKGQALRNFRRSCQMVFQDPFSSLNPRLTVLDIVGEAMLWHGLCTKAQLQEKVISLLAEVGLGQDCLYRYPHEFSGGQRQRISIARALSLQPKFIVCDEPVSALDVSVQAQVLNLLMDLREAHSLSYLFISHDLSVVRLISNRVAVMYLGHIVETGSTKEVLDTPRHPYTKALLSAVPSPGGSLSKRIVLKGEQPSPLNPPSGCPFHPRCLEAEDICRRECPALRGEGRQCACWKYDTE